MRVVVATSGTGSYQYLFLFTRDLHHHHFTAPVTLPFFAFPCPNSSVSFLFPDSGGREAGLELSTSRHGLLATTIDTPTPTPTPMTPSNQVAAAVISSISNTSAAYSISNTSTAATAITTPSDAASGSLPVPVPVPSALVPPAPTVQMRGIVALQGVQGLGPSSSSNNSINHSNNNRGNHHMGSNSRESVVPSGANVMTDSANNLPPAAAVNNNNNGNSASASASSSSLMKLFVGEIPSPPTSPVRALLPPLSAAATAGAVDVASGLGVGMMGKNNAGGEAVWSSEDRDKAPLLPAINRQVVSCMLLTIEFERR